MGFEVLDSAEVKMPEVRPLPPGYIPITMPCVGCGKPLGNQTEWFQASDGRCYHMGCYESKYNRESVQQAYEPSLGALSEIECYPRWQMTGRCYCGKHR